MHSRLRPLITFRDYHGTTHQNNSLNPSLAIELGRVTCSPCQGCPNLHLAHHAAEVRQAGNWYRNFEYSVEEQRGLDLQEDLFNPLVFDVRSEPRRARRKSGAAGYHWFADWGRDTMIAFARANPCDGAIRGCAAFYWPLQPVRIAECCPTGFPMPARHPHTNTVDATLWFFEAVCAFATHTEDYEFIPAKLYAVLADIISWHERVLVQREMENFGGPTGRTSRDASGDW